MNFDVKNEQHREALRWACREHTRVLSAELGSELARVYWRALYSAEQSAALVRALLEGFGIEPCGFPYPGFEDMKCCREKEHAWPHADCIGGEGYACVNSEHHARDWKGTPKPVEPGLVLALLDAKDRTGAIAACQEYR
jgi:hypothetical protein